MRQFPVRGTSLVEIAVALVLISILVLAVPRAMSSVVINAERQLQEAAAHRVGEAWLSTSLLESYADLDEYSAAVISNETMTFSRDGTDYSVDCVVERQVTIDSSLGAGKEVKVVTIRVSWPDTTDPVGQIVKATIVSQ